MSLVKRAKTFVSSPIEFAIRSLTRKPQTEAQIMSKLVKSFPKANHTEVIDRLKELNFINDADFVDRWLRYRSQNSVKGTYLLRRELLQKGVEEGLIKDRLASVNEEELIGSLIEKKWTHVKGKSLYHRKQKLALFLSSRGFNSSVIWDAIGKMTTVQNDANELLLPS